MKLEETEEMLEQRAKALETQLVSNNDLNSGIQALKDQLSEKLATSDQLGSKCDQLQKLVDDTTEEMEALKSVSEQIFDSPALSFSLEGSCVHSVSKFKVFVIQCSDLLDDQLSGRIFLATRRTP